MVGLLSPVSCLLSPISCLLHLMDPTIFACTKDNTAHTYRFPWRHFTHLLQDRATHQADKPALIFHDLDQHARSEISYAELEHKTATLAGCLSRDYGIAPGDRVAFALPNCPEIPLLTLALFRLGATSVPLDLAKDVPERKRYKLQDASAKLLCVMPEHEASEREIIPDIPIASVNHLLSSQADPADLEPEWSGNLEREQDTSIILYTSGTTGNPKGVLLTRQSITSNADGIIRWLGFDEHERLSLLLPLHHVNSTVFSITMLMTGGTLILNSRYSVSGFWPVIAAEKATATSIVPTIMADLLSQEDTFDREDHDIFALKKIMIGSAPVPANLACRFHDRFGVRLIQGYGATEVSLRVTGVPPDLPEDAYRAALEQNAIGVELAHNNIRIDGDPPEGELGEILVRGPVVAGGYLNKPDATAEVFKNGWFHTGDIGCQRTIADHTFYFIHGRKKEILIKGGVNISPIAVENALLEALPELAAAYVIGLRHDRWGEEVCGAVVFKNEGDPETIARITQQGQEGKIPGLSPYEAPAKIIAIARDDLPMTSTGKVQRSKLRDIIQEKVDRGEC
ncbi:MAG: class I adenylate-forming enzyme family protein [bacterium]|nr:class I adenylate-forming enzyme family protein [bacterium]